MKASTILSACLMLASLLLAPLRVEAHESALMADLCIWL